jgi:hypothetical protein
MASQSVRRKRKRKRAAMSWRQPRLFIGDLPPRVSFSQVSDFTSWSVGAPSKWTRDIMNAFWDAHMPYGIVKEETHGG